MEVVMRLRKDGGYSPCSAPDELVGKGRCCHVGDSQVFRMTPIQRNMYEIEVGDMPQLTLSGQRETIANFMRTLNQLDETTMNAIIKALDGE